MSIADRINRLEATRAAEKLARKRAAISEMTNDELDAEIIATMRLLCSDQIEIDQFTAFSAALARGDVIARRAMETYGSNLIRSNTEKMTEAQIYDEMAAWKAMLRTSLPDHPSNYA